MNNYSMDTILARLREGASAESIATELSDLMNSADKAYKAELEAKKRAEAQLAEEKRQKEEAEREKAAWLQDVLDDFDEWLMEYYPEVAPEDGFDADEILEAIGTIKNFSSFFSMFDGKNWKSWKNGKKTNEKLCDDNCDQIIDDWLSLLGL